jgi:hypothetical protein
MKIGEAYQTQSSSLYSAHTIGAPMHPAPIGVAVRTGKRSAKHNLNIIGAQCLVSRVFTKVAFGISRKSKFYTKMVLISRNFE